jgi:PAS domain S-box-containing protein
MNKDHYKDIIQKSKHLFYLALQEDHTISETNPALEMNLRFFQGPIVGMAFKDLIFPEDFSKYQYLLEKTSKSKKTTFEIDLRKLNSQGDDFIWTNWQFHLSPFESKYKVFGIGYTIHSDSIGKLKLPTTVSELHVKNDILEGLFENNLLGFWQWDIENKYDQFNASLQILLGYDSILTEKSKKQVKWKKHIHPLDLNHVEKQLTEHFESQGKNPFHCEFRVKSLNDDLIPVICSGKVVSWTQSGQPKLMVGTFFDISERKKSESILEQQNEFLKALTFNQSHLMRAKLANILGILEVIDIKKSPEEALDLLKIIKVEAVKLDKVLQESIQDSSNFSTKV